MNLGGNQMGSHRRKSRGRNGRRALTTAFCSLLIFAVGFGQAALPANAGGPSLTMGQVDTGNSGGARGASQTLATTLASLNVNLDQWANQPGQGWQNGDLNKNNSAYHEGDVVPFRLAVEGLSAGQHTIHLNYDFTAGGNEAYDFLATWNDTESPGLCASGGGAVSSLCPGLPAANTKAFASDPFAPGSPTKAGKTVAGAEAFAGVSRNLTLYGGTIDSVTVPSHSGPVGNNSSADIIVTFTTSGSAALFAWGAHIAQSDYWVTTTNAPNGAAAVSGAPWHMRTQNLDGSGNKNQDRSIQPSAIVKHPNVSVTKVADDATISAGQNAGFTITATNDGPGVATNVTLHDQLPSGVAWQESPDNPDCSISGGVLDCAFGDLAEGASASVHIVGPTDQADCGTLTNTATVAADNEDPGFGSDNSATATITVQCPDLKITKVADKGSVSAGDQVGYTVMVTNNGPGKAFDVVLHDTLPANPGLSWTVESTTGGWTCGISAGVLTCGGNGFNLASGASASVHITSPTTSATCGTISNTGTADASNDDQVSTGIVQVTVQCASLVISKVADDAIVNAGDPIGYTITVTNNGAGTAKNVVVSDTLPTNGGLNWSIDGGTGAADCSISQGVLTCHFGDMASGASKTVHISSPTTAATCGTVVNSASASTDNDGNPSTGPVTITVNCPAVQVVKTADNGTISAGDTAAFTIVVTNNGPGVAKGVTLTDTLPAGVDWQQDNQSCSITAGVLSCNFGDLASGATRTIHVSGKTDAADCGTLHNTATVSATNESSDDLGNNTSSADITVNCPGISVTKTADDTTVDAADQVGFTITVANAGPGTATDVHLDDPLPTNPGLDWSIDGGTGQQLCQITQGDLVCDFGDMPAKTSYTVHITSDTDATTCGEIDNTATVTISNADGGEASASITVNCPPLGIDIQKTGPTQAHVGDTITYDFSVQLTTPETLFNVTVSDPNCNEGAPVYVSGDDGDNALEQGEVWLYQCTHVVLDTDPDPLPNTATVQGTADDGRTTTDESRWSVDLIHPAIKIVKTVNPISGNPGDTVTYTYVVTNTGDTTLFNVSVDDDVIGHIGDIAQLDPGQSVTLTKDFVLPAGELGVTNVGTATGTDVLGKTVTDDDDASVTIVKAAHNPPTPPKPTAFTGSDAARLGLITLVLLGLGALALVIGRRRRDDTA